MNSTSSIFLLVLRGLNLFGHGPVYSLQGKQSPAKHAVYELAAGWKMSAAGIFAVLLLCLFPCGLHADNAACLACHADNTLQSAAGKSVAVDGQTFHSSVHGSLSCTDCHTTIKGFPHPDQQAPVKCATCHADQENALAGSVHAKASAQPCLSCHGSPHAIFPKGDVRSSVYPLNIPRTCGTCHASAALAKKYHLQNVYSVYMDSIHGYAVSKEGLLVAANCTSCHGSHDILSHTNPKSATYKTNIPKTCGTCHGGVKSQYLAGVHGKVLERGNLAAPACTDCHTAHAILQPTVAEFRMQVTPICGSCHKGRFATYQDTFHSQLGLLGGYVQTARCWDCHGAHEILPASDPRSPIAPANLVTTCGKCHVNPALYYIRWFMNLLLWSVLGFFALHTLLWFIRSKREKNKNGPAEEAKS
jgi:predicted CXXCH cytochrome family protein